MYSILLIYSSILIAAQSASVLPVDSTSSVQVKSNGQGYAYTIHENRGIPLEPLPGRVIPFIENPFLKTIPVNDLKLTKSHEFQIQSQDKSEQVEQTKIEKQEGQQKLEHIQNQLTEQKLEKPIEQLYIPSIPSYPDYRLVPNGDLQLVEYPYYHPYFNGYAYHYPYIRFH